MKFFAALAAFALLTSCDTNTGNTGNTPVTGEAGGHHHNSSEMGSGDQSRAHPGSAGNHAADAAAQPAAEAGQSPPTVPEDSAYPVDRQSTSNLGSSNTPGYPDSSSTSTHKHKSGTIPGATAADQPGSPAAPGTDTSGGRGSGAAAR